MKKKKEVVHIKHFKLLLYPLIDSDRCCSIFWDEWQFTQDNCNFYMFKVAPIMNEKHKTFVECLFWCVLVSAWDFLDLFHL